MITVMVFVRFWEGVKTNFGGQMPPAPYMAMGLLFIIT